MKSLQKDLQAIVKELKSLALTTEGLSRKLSRMETAGSSKGKKGKPQGEAKKAQPAVARRTKKAAAIDMVFASVKKSRKGANMAQIKGKTGFNDRKIWNAIYRLKKAGKVKSTERGTYVSI